MSAAEGGLCGDCQHWHRPLDPKRPPGLDPSWSGTCMSPKACTLLFSAAGVKTHRQFGCRFHDPRVSDQPVPLGDGE